MGKRELLIALAFVAVGAIAYQLTAPKAKEGEGFSFRKFWGEMQREVRGRSSRGVFVHTASLGVPAAVRELRFIETSGLQVIGEERADIAYELRVEAGGPDEPTALAAAKQTRLWNDDLGSSLAFRIDPPRDSGPHRVRIGPTALTMRVPRRLGVRIQGASRIDVSNVAAVSLDGATGAVKIGQISGPVSGLHRRGEIEITASDSVNLTLQASEATVADIHAGVTLDVRNGHCVVRNTKGPLEVDVTDARVTIAEHAGPMRVGGSGGRVTVERPTAETRLDMRRTEIEVSLRDAVPITLLTTDQPLRLMIDGAPKIVLDAVAVDGRLTTPGLDLQPQTLDRELRLSHSFAPGAVTRASLRNLRGEIVIRMMK